ncbi:YhcH/YjgK/YiaL family protein [Oscillospiraceae bacterium MB08-C2-2]|nr:YhcH/YjgK/YiaL family protein [Oscillospiraceae bacterium MB08-C2-2]
MLYTSIALAEKYNYLEEKFKICYEFLRRSDLADLPEGAIKLTEDITVQVQEYDTIPPNTGKFETHERFFDIQYMVSGQELFGIADRSELEIQTPYDSEKDMAFYKEPAYCGYILLKEGQFALVAPEDAHKPRCMAGQPEKVKKLVIKVPV